MVIRRPVAALLKWVGQAWRHMAGRNPYRPERRYMRGQPDRPKPPGAVRRDA